MRSGGYAKSSRDEKCREINPRRHSKHKNTPVERFVPQVMVESERDGGDPHHIQVGPEFLELKQVDEQDVEERETDEAEDKFLVNSRANRKDEERGARVRAGGGKRQEAGVCGLDFAEIRALGTRRGVYNVVECRVSLS